MNILIKDLRRLILFNESEADCLRHRLDETERCLANLRKELTEAEERDRQHRYAVFEELWNQGQAKIDEMNRLDPTRCPTAHWKP